MIDPTADIDAWWLAYGRYAGSAKEACALMRQHVLSHHTDYSKLETRVIAFEADRPTVAALLKAPHHPTTGRNPK